MTAAPNGTGAGTPSTNDTTNGNNLTASSNVYFINKNQLYEPLRPNPVDNLISLYGLDSIARSVARSNPDGSKGVKLRKSYKNHIADLPGKHIIPKERNLSYVAFRPRDNAPNPEIKPLDDIYLRKCLNFDKTFGSIPGFDTIKLGMVEDDIGASKVNGAGSAATNSSSNGTNNKRKASASPTDDFNAYNSSRKKTRN